MGLLNSIFNWDRRSPLGLLTSDATHVIIKLDKRQLETIGIVGRALVTRATRSNDGDWGGPDYSQTELSCEQVKGIVLALDRTC